MASWTDPLISGLGRYCARCESGGVMVVQSVCVTSRSGDTVVSGNLSVHGVPSQVFQAL